MFHLIDDPALVHYELHFVADQNITGLIVFYGQVYKAVLDHDQVVAIKFLSPMMKGSAHANAHFSNEVDIMRQSCHNNIVHFVGACFKAGVAFMVQVSR